MRLKACRRFTIGDGMVLVAATAVGFALFRWYSEALGAAGLDKYSFLTLGAACPLISWDLALAALYRRRPRPAARRLAGSAGPGSVLAIAFVGLLVMPPYIAARLAWPNGFPMSGGFDFVFVLAHMGGGIAAGQWMLSLMARRFRSGRGWIDWSGLVVSSLWFALLVGLLTARAFGNP